MLNLTNKHETEEIINFKDRRCSKCKSNIFIYKKKYYGRFYSSKLQCKKCNTTNPTLIYLKPKKKIQIVSILHDNKCCPNCKSNDFSIKIVLVNGLFTEILSCRCNKCNNLIDDTNSANLKTISDD